jgi:hypothetical protein
VTDVEYKKGDFGGLVRAKAWYDYTLEQKGVRHGSFATGYTQGAKLDDSNYEDLAKFSGVALLDAYVYGGFKLGDNRREGPRRPPCPQLGREHLHPGREPGEPRSTCRRFAVPGTEIKEVLMPVGMVLGQRRPWARHVRRGLSTSGSGRTPSSTVAAPTSSRWTPPSGRTRRTRARRASCSRSPRRSRLSFRRCCVARFPWGMRAARRRVPTCRRSPTKEAKDSGQWGLSLRMNASELDTEFGLYAMTYNSRVPILSTVKGNSPFPLTTQLLGAAREPVVALLGISRVDPPLRPERCDQHRGRGGRRGNSRTRPTSRCSWARATSSEDSSTARRPGHWPCSACPDPWPPS